MNYIAELLYDLPYLDENAIGLQSSTLYNVPEIDEGISNAIAMVSATGFNGGCTTPDILTQWP